MHARRWLNNPFSLPPSPLPLLLYTMKHDDMDSERPIHGSHSHHNQAFPGTDLKNVGVAGGGKVEAAFGAILVANQSLAALRVLRRVAQHAIVEEQKGERRGGCPGEKKVKRGFHRIVRVAHRTDPPYVMMTSGWLSRCHEKTGTSAVAWTLMWATCVQKKGEGGGGVEIAVSNEPPRDRAISDLYLTTKHTHTHTQHTHGDKHSTACLHVHRVRD